MNPRALASWALRRLGVLPFALVFSHATVFLWEALSPNYIYWAQLVAEWILVPIHPAVVWVVESVFPFAKTLISNKRPTHANAATIFSMMFFTLYMSIGMLLTYFVGRLVAKLSRPIDEPSTDTHVFSPPPLPPRQPSRSLQKMIEEGNAKERSTLK